MKKLRVVILGQGRSGAGIHGKYLVTDNEKYEIVAVVDPIKERRERAEKEYGCKAYEHYSELYKRDDIDLIINAAPSHMHVPITLELLERGYNVLSEKPLAGKAEEVDKLIETSSKGDNRLFVFQQSRFAPYFKKVREIIDSGVLGRIIQVSIAFNGFVRRWDWQCITECNGGSLLNTGPHPLDQALQLFGTDMLPEVTCIMDRVNTFGNAEDYVKIILKGNNRPVIDLEISSCCAYPSFTYNIQGQYGGLNGSMQHIDWKYYKIDEAPEQHLIKTPLRTIDGEPAYCVEDLKWYEESWDVPEDKKDLFNAMCREYYDCLYNTLVKNEQFEIKLEEVKNQIAVIEECHRQNPHIWEVE